MATKKKIEVSVAVPVVEIKDVQVSVKEQKLHTAVGLSENDGEWSVDVLKYDLSVNPAVVVESKSVYKSHSTEDIYNRFKIVSYQEIKPLKG